MDARIKGHIRRLTERVIRVLKFFFGGNFVQSNDPKAELEMMNYVLSISPTYNRFLTYAHIEHALRIIETLKSNPRVNLILDSGAYTKDKDKYPHVDFSKVENVQRYIDFLKEQCKSLDYYVNADVMGDGERSWRNYRIMKRNGFNHIPVWHAGTNEEYLLRYQSETNLLGIGGIAGKRLSTKKNIERLDSIFPKHLLYKDGFPKARYHAFGLRKEILKRYPFWSADSTDWVFYSGRLATILVPKWKDGKWDYLDKPYEIKICTRHDDTDHHLLTIDPQTRKEVMRYLKECGIQYGFFVYVEKGKKMDDIPGLYNSQALRDRVNVLFYIKFAESPPPWPWAFKLI